MFVDAHHMFDKMRCDNQLIFYWIDCASTTWNSYTLNVFYWRLLLSVIQHVGLYNLRTGPLLTEVETLYEVFKKFIDISSNIVRNVIQLL